MRSIKISRRDDYLVNLFSFFFFFVLCGLKPCTEISSSIPSKCRDLRHNLFFFPEYDHWNQKWNGLIFYFLVYYRFHRLLSFIMSSFTFSYFIFGLFLVILVCDQDILIVSRLFWLVISFLLCLIILVITL